MTSVTIRLLPCWILLMAVSLCGQESADVNGVSAGPPNKQASLAKAYIASKLWRERIQAPESRRGNDTSELQSLIAKLRSTHVPSPSAIPAAPLVDANALPGDPEVSAPPTPLPAPPVGPTTLTAPIPTLPVARGPLRPETLAQIERMADQTMDPGLALRLADLLYESQYRDRATPFYRLATETLDPNAPLAHENRAWALFQLGNCQRESAPAEAKLAYQRLTSEYPTAPWADLATMWHDLADWYWREQPRETLDEVTPPQDEVVLTPTPVKGDTEL